jgi:hypothetical protein
MHTGPEPALTGQLRYAFEIPMRKKNADMIGRDFNPDGVP